MIRAANINWFDFALSGIRTWKTYCTLFFPPIYINCSLGVEVWKQEVVGYPEAVAGDGLDLLPGPSALYPTGQQGIPALETSQGLWKHVRIILV